MLDAHGKPTPRLTASNERELLEGRLQRLQDLKARILDGAGENTRERTRADAVQVAIDHVQAAIDALALASQE